MHMSFYANPKFRLIFKIVLSLIILIACFIYIDVSKLPDMLVNVHLGYLFLALILNIIGSILIPALITKEALKTGKVLFSLLAPPPPPPPPTHKTRFSVPCTFYISGHPLTDSISSLSILEKLNGTHRIYFRQTRAY